MALQKLVLRPGVNKEGTSYANENGFYNSDKVRFRSGYAEKIGGWINVSYSATYKGVARSLFAWASLVGEKLLGIGTTQKFYIQNGGGGEYYDITPLRTVKTLTDPFSITSGSLLVTVASTSHGATPGTSVTFTKAIASLVTPIISASLPTTVDIITGVGTFTAPGVVTINNEQIAYASITAISGGYTLSGLTRGYNNTSPTSHISGSLVLSNASISTGNITLTGEFDIVSATANDFTIVAPSMSTTTSASWGGTVYALFQLNSGGSSYTSAVVGWGAVGWGEQGWGTATAVTTTYEVPIRLWSQSNYDENLLFAPRYGSIYWWEKNTSSFPRAITLNEKANSVEKTRTGAIYTSGSTYITVLDNSGINIGSVIVGPGIPSGTYVDNTYAFGDVVPLSSVVNTIPNITCSTTINTTYTGNITVTSQTWPDSGLIEDGGEFMVYERVNSTTLNITERGYNDTTAVTHTAPWTAVFAGGADVVFNYAGRHIPVETLVVSTSSSNAFTIAFGATPYDPYNFSTEANFDPLLVRWSDQDNPFEWIPETTNQSGEQRLANGSYIVTAVNTRQEILIWTDTALYSMQYLGPPYVFGINLLMDNISIASPNAAITVNSVTYWMGVDKFYAYSGRVDTLPCTLRQFVYTNINRSQLYQVVCGANEGFNEIWWFYPTADSQINNRYIIYNHLEQIWYYGDLNRTAWLDTQLEQFPIAAYSTEKTYLNGSVDPTQTEINVVNASSFPPSGSIVITTPLGTYTTSQLVTGGIQINYGGGAYGPGYYGIVVGTPYTCTSTSVSGTVINVYYDGIDESWYIELSTNVGSSGTLNFQFQVGTLVQTVSYTGISGNTFTGCIQSSPKYNLPYATVTSTVPNCILGHEYGYDDQSTTTPLPIEAYVESSDFDIGDGMNFAYVWRIIPDLSFSGSTVTNPQCQLTVRVRQNSGAAYTAHSSDEQTVTRTATYPVEVYTGQVYTRVRGRQMAFRMGSDGLGVFWQMGMMRIDVRQDGRR